MKSIKVKIFNENGVEVATVSFINEVVTVESGARGIYAQIEQSGFALPRHTISKLKLHNIYKK